MKCNNCGTENAPLKKCCENCGKFLEGETINNVTGEFGYRDENGAFHVNMEIKKDLFPGEVINTGRITSKSNSDNAKELLDALTDDERKQLFGNYCKFCGNKKLPCFCERDD